MPTSIPTTMVPDDTGLPDRIAGRLAAEGATLRSRFQRSRTDFGGIAWIDDLLPNDMFAQLPGTFPDKSEMARRRSRGERKYVLARTRTMKPALETIVRALASQQVADAVAEALGLDALSPDPDLYNGGITVMAPGDFMRPHLDNSHNASGRRHRRIVALLYLSPEWRSDWCGTLRMWSDVARSHGEAIDFVPNRLVLMETAETSWHSVDPIRGPADRVNITTYFYDGDAAVPLRLTRFTGWPGERWTGWLLSAVFHARSFAHRLGMRRFVRNRHVDVR